MKEDDIDKSLVYLQGRSLGGAVAIYTGAQYPNLFRGLIIENTFTSMGDMVDHIVYFLKYVKRLVLRNKWNSLDLVREIKTPMLYITGD